MKNVQMYPENFGIKFGIEKESLRCDESLSPVQTQHPASLGSPLRHPMITTDFSETLVEMITGVHDDLDELLSELEKLHVLVANAMPANEVLWCSSMPPYVADEEKIKIAEYGNSNQGKMKYLYRVGLANRYNRIMQIISGIHYNVSFDVIFLKELAEMQGLKFSCDSNLKSHFYMHTVRNFLNTGWIIPYLFGASPIAMLSSVLNRNVLSLHSNDGVTFSSPYATSIRLSPLGYQNKELLLTDIKYDDVKQYALQMLNYVQTPSNKYGDIPDVSEENPQQLNKNILQIENEFYNIVRPKPLYVPEEMPAISLLNNGVEYLELRIFDLNPFDPLGVNKGQLEFTNVLLINCLLNSNSEINPFYNRNLQEVYVSGYNPLCEILNRRNESVKLSDEVLNLFCDLFETAEWMDSRSNTSNYAGTIEKMYNEVESGSYAFMDQRLLDHVSNYDRFVYDLSKEHTDHLRSNNLSRYDLEKFNDIAKKSNQSQAELERLSRDISFQDYYKKYTSQAAIYPGKITTLEE